MRKKNTEYKFYAIFSTLDGKGGFGHTKQSKDEFFAWIWSLKLLDVTLDNLAVLFCRILYFNVTAKRKPPCYTETVGGENSMKKQQVEYKVNLIGETELSEWLDEVVELLVEMFAERLV